MKLKAFLALSLLFSILLPALAQTKPAAPSPPQQTNDDKDDVVKITTNLVQVDAVVTKDGKPVSNLTAEDFEIFEDGRRQTITSFAYISNIPNSVSQPSPVAKQTTDAAPYAPLKPDEARRTVAFVVDDLGLSAESMSQVRRQLQKFVAEQLQPNDLVAVIRTGGEMGALQQFTNDKRLLNRAVDQLRWNMCNRVGINVLARVGSGASEPPLCGFRSIYNTLKSLRFIVDAMGYLPGRKSLVILSDSLPRESQDELAVVPNSVRETGVAEVDLSSLGRGSVNHFSALEKIAEKAIRSSVVIYSVDTQGLQYTGITAADSFSGSPQQMQMLMSTRWNLIHLRREGGELIAKQTGGFQIRNSNFFELKRIMEDQSGYYLLGYRPTEETFNKRFHHIKAKVKRSGMTLRTRFGFVGVTEEESARAKPSVRDLANIALASPFAAQDIEVDLTSFFISDATGSIVRSFVYLDGKDLTFTDVNGKHESSIELSAIIFGDNGAVVDRITRGATLTLSKGGDYEQAMREGIGLKIDLPVKRPGFYQVRVAARDRNSSRIGSAGEFVAVPNLNNKELTVSGIVLGNVNEFTGAAGIENQGIANPGARRFERNADLYFVCAIYNSLQSQNLVMETKLFRDGKIVYSGAEVPIDLTKQPDRNRVFVSGVVKLKPELELGSYYLQVVVTDKAAKKKTAPVVQWVDFDIVQSPAR
jgi:VWFA-related protein